MNVHTGYRSTQKALESSGQLSAAKRKALPKSKFGMPGERKYLMPDKSHAANAKARATSDGQQGQTERIFGGQDPGEGQSHPGGIDVCSGNSC